MTVADLLAALEGLPEDLEVRVAAQPRWPMEHRLGRPVVVGHPGPAGTPEAVYLALGEQLGYLDLDLAEEVFA